MLTVVMQRSFLDRCELPQAARGQLDAALDRAETVISRLCRRSIGVAGSAPSS
jgi:hypothetical protein